MYWAAGTGLLQHALLLATWLSLPLLAGITLTGLLAGMFQGWLGGGDPGSLIAPKLLVAAVVVMIFGAWMLSLTCGYWGHLWLAAPTLVHAR